MNQNAVGGSLGEMKVVALCFWAAIKGSVLCGAVVMGCLDSQKSKMGPETDFRRNKMHSI